ncbi:rod shape-determining protein MreC [Pedococcus dokdonensis]|uniref:Cell shape-determining protein MreC n=1 Tax=Pedococcus dokdonensis TaxID=443156 RepID=A0A1H0QDB1_9MICO|nr:rod shape-determining protein MreC [Pedococcus dokdonensis]SDP14679.1 rod shape-determining protein MreC [Pedococcus dokdonensis]
MRSASRRRLLVVLLALTAVLIGLDVAGAPGAAQLRAAGGAAFGPLERFLAPAVDRDGIDDSGARTGVLRDQLASQTREGAALARLTGAPDLAGSTFLPARVVGVGRQGAAGPERVTLDVGSKDGVRADLSVVAADGLVGRVVEVSPWTCDVQLLGSADVVVGVRVGAAGALGSVGSGARGPQHRPAGQLNLTVVERGSVTVGDPVTTLGSVGGSPFPAGLRVGTVQDVDTAPGGLTPTAAVRPAVDLATLDVVGVLLHGPRSTPRTPATGQG